MILLNVGPPKVGKTVSAATFPKPMLFIDYDNGFKSVWNAKDKSGKLVVSDPDDITVLKFYNTEFHDLVFKTSDAGKGVVAEYHAEALQKVEKLNTVLKQLHKDSTYEGKGPFQTVVIDSLTAMFLVWKSMIMQINKVVHLRMQDYGTLEEILYMQFIPSLYAIAEKIPYVVCIDHVQIDKDELVGRVLEFPVGPSKNQGKNLPRAFDEVFLQEMTNDGPVWNTKDKGLFKGAGSRSHFPALIKPATFNSLQQLLRG